MSDRKELASVIKTAQIFDKALNALFWIFLVCACIAGAFVLLSFIPGVPMDRLMDMSSISLSMDFVELELEDIVFNSNPRIFLIYTCVIMLVPAAFSAVGCRELRKVVAPLTEGRPFTDEASNGIRNIAVIYLAAEVVSAIAEGAIGTFLFRAYDLGNILVNEYIKAAVCDINADINILVPILLLVISWIVKYGTGLQKLEDETL